MIGLSDHILDVGILQLLEFPFLGKLFRFVFSVFVFFADHVSLFTVERFLRCLNDKVGFV